jgi:hypothetical protein
LPEKGLARTLYILGGGVCFPDHLSIETIDAMNACKRIYTNMDENQVSRLSEEFRPKCISLWPLYRDNRTRLENYAEVIQTVEQAIAKENPVAWLTLGHPLVLDSVSKGLQNSARSKDWNVLVLPAISCIDTLLTDVLYDPAGGLLIHEATAVMRQNIPLVPSVATLLLQPHVFNSDYPRINFAAGPDLHELNQYLLKFYPRKHRCAFVRSACAPGGVCEITWSDLCDIATISFASIKGSSLFIPPVLRGG